MIIIIAGTSIGAINSSVLVGHYMKNNYSLEGSAVLTCRLVLNYYILKSLKNSDNCSFNPSYRIVLPQFAKI
jgi:hypothetical protein